MTQPNSLAQKIRDKLNIEAGKEIARTLTTTEELMQVADWIPMPEYFNKAAGGQGFPCGHITQIIGESDTGKTTLCMAGMISTQKEGGLVFLVDSEHKFSFERFALMGGISQDVITVPVDSLEEAWNAMGMICTQIEEEREKNPNLKAMVVWDSIAASVPDAILEAEAEDAHVSVEAKINNKEIRKIRKRVRNANICAVFINHTYQTMPKFGVAKEVIKGGGEMYFQSTLILKTKRRAWLDREVSGMRQRYGTHSHLEVFKGHMGGMRNTTEFYIVDKGILDGDAELKAYTESLKSKKKDQ